MTRRQKNQLAGAIRTATRQAHASRLPQTVWQTNDKDAPFMARVNGSEFKSELKPQPVVTILPERYFF